MAGEQHRRQRKMLNPVFSIANMREMSACLRSSTTFLFRPSALQYRYSTMLLVKFVSFKVIQFITDTLTHLSVTGCDCKQSQGRTSGGMRFSCPSIMRQELLLIQIEILSWMTRTALELIGQSGFGYSFDNFAEDSIPSPYAVSVKKFL